METETELNPTSIHTVDNSEATTSTPNATVKSIPLWLVNNYFIFDRLWYNTLVVLNILISPRKERGQSFLMLSGITKLQPRELLMPKLYTSQHVVASLTQQIRKEMNDICSTNHYSLLRDSYEAVKQFSWESIWLEYEAKVPTLFTLLTGLLPKAEKRFIAFVMSLLLKRRCKHMSLVQRVISPVLYGNAAKKQVDIPMHLCLWYIINLCT